MVRMLRMVLACLLVTGGSAWAVDPPTQQVALSEVELDENLLRVHFIDVGNGLAILIETPGDRAHLFVDGGDEGLNNMERYVRKFVEDNPIDIAIVTHADHDHYYGLNRILDSYDVHQFWNTGYTSRKLRRNRSRWSQLLDKVDGVYGIQIYMPISDWVEAGTFESIDDGGTPDDDEDDVWIQYLNVDKKPPKKDPDTGRWFDEGMQRNNASLVFKVVYGDVSFLIPGDINGRDKYHTDETYDDEIDSEEAELVRNHELDDVNYGLKATVLQAAHHGSNGSSSLGFLRAVAPDWIVIPAGAKGHDHPDENMLRRVQTAGVPDDHVLRNRRG